MDRNELQQLLDELETAHGKEAQAITTLRNLREHWDNFSTEGKGRMEQAAKQAMGRAQIAADRLPDYRGDA